MDLSFGKLSVMDYMARITPVRTKYLGALVLVLLLFSVSVLLQTTGRGLIRSGTRGADDGPIPPELFSPLPMCDAATGFCHEAPDVPTPRTVYSGKNREQYELWWEAHRALNRSAEEYASRVRAEKSDGKRPLILLGDSIMESWLGTNMGRVEDRARGVPSVLRDLAERGQLAPLVLAIGGDQTQHLLWRLQHGELLPAYTEDTDVVFVALIGTNNLGSGILPKPTISGVLAVARYVLAKTKGRLVLFQLLPRGDSQKLSLLCPPRCDAEGEPFQSFMPAVEEVNSGILKAAPGLAKRYPGRLDWVDCGSGFLGDASTKGGGGDEERPAVEVNENLMPDRLHPNAKGHQILAKCLLDCIEGSCGD